MTTSTLYEFDSDDIGNLSSQDQLWLFSELFRPEWSRAITVDNEYKTNVEAGTSQAEQRYGLRSKPMRAITVRFQAGGRDISGVLTNTSSLTHLRETSALITLARRYSMAKTPFPLFTDEAILTASVLSGYDTFMCDTTNKRFEVGKRVVIVDNNTEVDGPYYSHESHIHVATISGVQDDRVVISEVDGSGGFSPGARIIPLIEAQLMFNSKGNIITDALIDLTVTAIEEEGPTQLSGITAVGTNPSGFTVAEDGIPVFEPNYDYSEGMTWEMKRAGARASSGIGGRSEAFGSYGMIGFNFRMKYFDRDSAFADLSFFDSRGGKLHPFWLIPPVRETYGVSTILFSGTQVAIRGGGDEIDWISKPYLYFKKNDGTIHIGKIESALRFSQDNYVALLESAIDVTTETLVEAGTVYKSRFDIDKITESWTTTGVMTADFKTTEIEKEKSITITNLVGTTTADLVAEFVQGNCSGELPDPNTLLIPCDGCGSDLIVDSDTMPVDGKVIQVSTTAWTSTASVTKGDIWIPSGGVSDLVMKFNNEHVAFIAETDGTTSGTEPTWEDLGCGDTLVDGTVTWRRTSDCFLVASTYQEITYPAPGIENTLDDCAECEGLSSFECESPVTAGYGGASPSGVWQTLGTSECTITWTHTGGVVGGSACTATSDTGSERGTWAASPGDDARDVELTFASGWNTTYDWDLIEELIISFTLRVNCPFTKDCASGFDNDDKESLGKEGIRCVVDPGGSMSELLNAVIRSGFDSTNGAGLVEQEVMVRWVKSGSNLVLAEVSPSAFSGDSDDDEFAYAASISEAQFYDGTSPMIFEVSCIDHAGSPYTTGTVNGQNENGSVFATILNPRVCFGLSDA